MKIDERLQKGHSFVGMYRIALGNVREAVARNPLVAAFLISLVIHGLLFGGWRMGKSLGWWDHQATWLLNITKKLQATRVLLARFQPPPPRQEMREIPLTFMEVDPTLAIPEPPKDAKFYGAKNSAASNPDNSFRTDPKVDGRQTEIVKAEDVPRPKPFPLQPAIAPPAPPQEVSKKSEPAGDLAKVEKGEDKPHEKPRTLAQALAQKNMLVGPKVLQDGGVRARGRVSFSVQATPFGAYDAAFIAAVQQRWYDLLDSSHFTQQSGKVVLEFRLMYDGRITDLKVNGNDVGELLGLLCERAILDPAPYPQWPSDMRRMIGQNFREVTFTFYYN